MQRHPKIIFLEPLLFGKCHFKYLFGMNQIEISDEVQHSCSEPMQAKTLVLKKYYLQKYSEPSGTSKVELFAKIING